MQATRRHGLVHRTGRLAALAALLILVAARGAAPSGPVVAARTTPGAPASQGKWTIMVYMNGASDLENWLADNINQMEMVALNPDVQVVVQCKTLRETLIPTKGGTTSAKRLKIVHDDDPEAITSPVLEDLGNASMDDPKQLVDFVRWADKRFPAERHVLILWDHASSFMGFGGDHAVKGADGLSLAEIKSALDEISQSTSIEKWDIIGWDACLMASLEVDLALVPYAHYALASEEVAPCFSWAYDKFLASLVKKPAQSPVELGRAIIDTTVTMWVEYNRKDATLSLVDLSAVEELATQVNNLGKALQAHLPEGMIQTILPQRVKTMVFARGKAIDTGNYVDIGDLCRNLGGDPEIAQQTSAVTKALGAGQGAAGQGAVVYNRTGSLSKEATGLQLYFPSLNPIEETFGTTDLAEPAAWGSFLAAYKTALEPLTREVPGVTIQSASAQASPARPAVVTYSAHPVLVGLRNHTIEIGQGVTVDGKEHVDIIGVVDLDRQQSGQFSASWDTRVLMLSDGTRTVPLGARPEEPGSKEWQADIRLIRADGEEEGGLAYLALQEDGSVSLTGVATYDSEDRLGKSELPGAGDRLIPLYTRVLLSDGSSGYELGEVALTVPEGGSLTASLRAVTKGDYTLMVWAQTLAETRGFAHAGVSVP